MKIKLKEPVPYSWEFEREDVTYPSVDISKLRLYRPKGKTMEAVREEVKNLHPANQAVLDYLIAHPDEAPEGFKDHWLFFFGSKVRDEDGHWLVPCADWDGSVFHHSAYWLGYGWDSDDWVVLLGDLDTDELPVAETDLRNIAARLARVEEILKHHRLEV